tara:strand:- start:1265 stop:2164 length:900 start_codon:yes stop_codon:yes gene_type:complete
MTHSINNTDNNEIYKTTLLTIPDLVLPEDIPYITNWFDYYGIANVENVDVYEHPEAEYYVEDRPIYGYAVIKIREWYKNNSSKNFYNNLISGCAAIIYDDPHYWNVELIETPERKNEYPVNNIVENLNNKFDNVQDKPNENRTHLLVNEDMARWEYNDPDEADILGNRNDEDYYSYDEETYCNSEAQKTKELMETDEKKNDDEDEDEPRDEDYEFKETDKYKEEYLKYEYVHLKLKRHKMETRSKTKCKENKSKKTDLDTENITLEDLIVRKNKNYTKRDKRKPFKNEWSRRLRRKLEV